MSIAVIVRVANEADALDHCLRLVRAQRGSEVELIVVDNDSHDGSAAVARRHGAQVTRISAARFSFGRALNLGASLAHASLLVALSAHAFPPDPDWLTRLGGVFADPAVVCASGERFWPDGSPLRGPVQLDARLARGYPRWGYSNGAGAFRASAWQARHFREDLPGAEDKEWSRHWALHANLITVLSPELVVHHDHTHDPVRSIFARARREELGFRGFIDRPTAARPSLWQEWFWDTRFYSHPWRARMSHRRMARLLGERAGGLEARGGGVYGALSRSRRSPV